MSPVGHPPAHFPPGATSCLPALQHVLTKQLPTMPPKKHCGAKSRQAACASAPNTNTHPQVSFQPLPEQPSGSGAAAVHFGGQVPQVPPPFAHNAHQPTLPSFLLMLKLFEPSVPTPQVTPAPQVTHPPATTQVACPAGACQPTPYWFSAPMTPQSVGRSSQIPTSHV
ncbi:hypothetical protein FRC12_019715 [Ceratobasidium sp. 428]|nr:hypothetical protein FRC12_019715 [Ceratobasidium sp. 428]